MICVCDEEIAQSALMMCALVVSARARAHLSQIRFVLLVVYVAQINAHATINYADLLLVTGNQRRRLPTGCT